ncbi:hypothetical protein INH39_15415 [Massilia violaceinigra]|uniref:Uncharacterized protein n=1 Tax=Massilia violaceinigra TaxID=2045208 RepID=A0ABY4AG66_9BURK|nr:hypothetical protein [Massilia violaceinigra]UOD32919.1 hypothetical protein INH39_15415 [Massilia violaceinigra]
MRKILQGADAVSNVVKSFDNLVDAWRLCETTKAIETSKRTQITAARDVQVKMIEENAAVLKLYLGGVFAERRHVIDGMFARLDRGLDSGNMELASEAINAIINVTQSSPLAGARELIADIRNPSVKHIEI